MIRPFRAGDLQPVLQIWLDSNTTAHSFISPSYWQDRRELVHKALPNADVYLYELEGAVVGFIGLSGDEVEGLFVAEGRRSCGIGKALLDYVKARHPHLALYVYEKNTRAMRFYLREGFIPSFCRTAPDTGEAEYYMEFAVPSS